MAMVVGIINMERRIQYHIRTNSMLTSMNVYWNHAPQNESVRLYNKYIEIYKYDILKSESFTQIDGVEWYFTEQLL